MRRNWCLKNNSGKYLVKNDGTPSQLAVCAQAKKKSCRIATKYGWTGGGEFPTAAIRNENGLNQNAVLNGIIPIGFEFLMSMENHGAKWGLSHIESSHSDASK